MAHFPAGGRAAGVSIQYAISPVLLLIFADACKQILHHAGVFPSLADIPGRGGSLA